MGDYAELCGQKSSAENQLSSKELENLELAEQITLLKDARKIVYKEKYEFEQVIKRIQTVIESSYKWKGQNFDDFIIDCNTLNDNNYIYLDSIDNVLDEINDKITELENQMCSNEGVIGWLRVRINELFYAIENLFK